MKALALTIVFIILLGGYAFSDMGAILPVEEVTLTEPAQRAIIAHDGFSEILILSTDLDVQEGTKVVRFIPFPSKVTIYEGRKETFGALQEIVKKYGIRYLRFLKGGHSTGEGVEVVSTQTLGPHKVVQVKVNDFSDFKIWVSNLFKEEGIEKKGFTQKEEEIVFHYLKSGINYFVFDIVNLSPGVNSVAPLVYKFDTSRFYYPLVTSSLFPGEGTIELFILSNYGEILERVAFTPMPHPWKRSETAILTWEDMEKIDPHIAKLLGEHAILGVVKYTGTYEIGYDIWFDVPIHEIKPTGPINTRKR